MGMIIQSFIDGTNLERSKGNSGGVNFIVAVDKIDERDTFSKGKYDAETGIVALLISCREGVTHRSSFFESVRVLVTRLMNKGVGKKISLPEMNARINELLKSSVQSDGVINLFSDVDKEFSLFDPKFLEEISKMKEKKSCCRIA